MFVGLRMRYAVPTFLQLRLMMPKASFSPIRAARRVRTEYLPTGSQVASLFCGASTG
jgi:hypothetical protein